MIRLISVALALFAAVATTRVALAQEAAATNGDGVFSEAQREAIRAEALAAILAYPEIIEEAMAILEEQKANKALAAVLRDPNTPVLGNPDGAITLIEFFDYNCGYCKRMADPMRDLIAEIDDLRIIMVEVPILSQESYEASQAALAVNMVGGDYSQVHFDAMTARGRTSVDTVLASAQTHGVNQDILRAVMTSEAIEDTITRNYDAMRSLDISGTPAFIVAGSPSPTSLTDINLMPGAVPVEELRSTIEMTRAGS